MTDLRILSGQEVRQLAPFPDLISWMRDAMILSTKRNVSLPLRQVTTIPDGLGKIGMMPGYIGGDVVSAGVKLVSLVPPEKRKGSSHLGLMVLYDGDGLLPIAILCGSTITAIRTAAMTAAATDALALKNASVLAILGTGEQAVEHALALQYVRNFSEMRVWGHNADNTAAFASKLETENGLSFTVCPTVTETVKNADVICTVTGATHPILYGDMVSEGTHVNLVGSSHRGATETDATLVQKSDIFIDYLPSVMDQAGELLQAMEDGIISKNHIKAEIGSVFANSHAGRENNNNITLYKSLGVASQDIITARKIYDLACSNNVGQLTNI